MTPTAHPSQLVDIQTLSARTGLSVSTIRRLKNAGKITCFQPAGKCGKLLFPPDAIERASQSTKTVDQVEQPVEAQSPKRLSGPLPAWMQRPSMNNPT
jgi:hypothetical protein